MCDANVSISLFDVAKALSDIVKKRGPCLTFDGSLHGVDHERDGDEQSDDFLRRPGEDRQATDVTIELILQRK